MTRIPGIRFALLLSLTGCHVIGSIPSATLPDGSSPIASVGRPVTGSRVDSGGGNDQGALRPFIRTGTVRMAVRWPARTTQLVPGRTNAVRVTFRDGTGAVVQSHMLVREASTSVSQFTASLPAEQAYVLKAEALASTGPDALVLAESRELAPLRVTWNAQIDVRLELVPTFVPRIVTNTGGSAGAGATLGFTGVNLDGGEAWFTFPGGQRIKGVLTGERLEVVVPAGAGSGRLSLDVDRVPARDGNNPVNPEPLPWPFTFQELTQLSVRGVASDDIDRNGRQAIETWIGDRFNLVASGRDSSGSAVADPAHTSLTTSVPAIGTFGQSGVYDSLALGSDVVEVRSGNLVSTRSIRVAPPAGPTWRPISPVSSPNAVQDLSLIRVKDRFLALWYQPGAGVCWQFLSLTGEPQGTVNRFEISSANSDERAVRAAAWGDWVVVAVRCSGTYKTFNQFVALMLMDPVTGQMIWDSSQNRPELFISKSVIFGNQRLDNLVAGADGLVLSMFSLDSTVGWQHEVVGVTPTASGRVTWRSGSLFPSASSDIRVKEPLKDHLAVAPTSTGYVFAQTMEHSAGTVVRKSTLAPEGNEATASIWMDLLPDGRNLALASADGGQSHLVSGLSVKNGQTSVITYLINQSLGKVSNSQRTQDTWNHAFPGSLAEPVTLAWNGSRFILSYVRYIPDPGNPQASLAQPMVRALLSDGAPDGEAFPAAPAGKSPTIVATPEGALAAWIDTSGRLAVRRMRFQAVP